MRSKNEIFKEIQGYVDRAEDIQENADKAGRDLTESENKEIDSILAKVGRPAGRGKPASGLHQEMRLACANEGVADTCGDDQGAWPLDSGETPRPKKGSGQVFTDIRDGSVIRALTPSDRWQAATPTPAEYDYRPSLGRAIVGAVTGRWEDAPMEFRAASGGSAADGGFLVPDFLSGQVIDMARAASVCVKAGASTIIMPTETVRLAKQAGDPTFETKGENEAFTDSDVTFGCITLVARTVGTVIQASRELIEDAPNAAAVIENMLAGGLGAELDRQFLQGDSSEEMHGLIGHSDVETSDASGAIAWSHLAEAVEGVWTANREPNAFILHPSIASDLATLTSGDGTNSAELWQTAPPSVAPLTQLRTTNCPSANIALGDFSYLGIGLRKQARVQISEFADNAFSEYAVRIRIVWRGSVAVLDPAAFHVIEGITT